MPRLFFWGKHQRFCNPSRATMEWFLESVKLGKFVQANTSRPPSQVIPQVTASKPVACGESEMVLSTCYP
jgi:hypothetical protein